jgi:hypothetical protein
LAGHALPFAVAANPGVGKAAGPLDNLPFDFDFFFVFAGNDGRVFVDADGNTGIRQLQKLIALVANLGQPTLFILEQAVIAGIDEALGEKKVERFGITIDFGVIPGGFESDDAGAFRGRARSLRRRNQAHGEERGCESGAAPENNAKL